MTADAREFSVGSGVEIEGAVNLGLESACDRKEVGNSNGIACLVDEEKLGGRGGRPIVPENRNLNDSSSKDPDLNGAVDPVTTVGDEESGQMEGENREFSMENRGHQDENPAGDVEGEVIESDLNGAVVEGDTVAIGLKMEHERVDEKERDIRNGHCEENREISKEVADVKVSFENGNGHAKSNGTLEASKVDFVPEVGKKQDDKTQIENVKYLKELDSTVKEEKISDSQAEQVNLEASVNDDDDDKQEPKSEVLVTDQQEAIQLSILENNDHVPGTVSDNIDCESEEKTVDILEDKQGVVTSTTGAESPTDIDALLEEPKEPQSVLITPDKFDNEQLVFLEATKNEEQVEIELTTEVQVDAEPQTLADNFENQDEQTSSVEVSKKQDAERLVIENFPTESSCEQTDNGSCSVSPDELLDENVNVKIADNRCNLQTVGGIESFQSREPLTIFDMDTKVNDGDPIMTSDSVFVKRSDDLHPTEDSSSSDVPEEIAVELPISTTVLSDSNAQSDRCVEASTSVLEGSISNAVEVPIQTEDVPDKLGSSTLDNGGVSGSVIDAAVDDVDVIKSESTVEKETLECNTSLVSSTKHDTSMDVDENKAEHVEPGVIQEIQVTVKDPSSSSLDGEKVDITSGKPRALYIIRIPRFIDDQLSTKIQNAQSEVDEETQTRDSVKVHIEKQKAIRNEFWKKFGAARAEEGSARAAVNAKRQQMDSIQITINKLKSVNSIEELDEKIQSMEFGLQHETMPLKEEKKCIHELKQLKQQRDQLALNMGSKIEIDEAVEQKEQIDEKFKISKSELESLRSEVSRTEAIANAAKKKYEEEQHKLKGLQQQFRDADAVRQKAYGRWRELRSMLIEKNKHFNMYKIDQRSAMNYMSTRNFEELRLHCSKQVETVMALWNNDEEFRNQYIKSNMNSTLRRLRTSDGRSLGPDEKPPVLRTNQFRVSAVPAQLAKTTESVPPVALKSQVESPKEVDSFPDLQSATKDHPVLPKKPVKLSSKKAKKPVVVARVPEAEIENEKASIRTKEEEELIKKAEELAKKEEEQRKEKAAAELKEHNRLEQITKAKQAEERKRRQAEKAQVRAEYRTRKEAEAREKKRAQQQKKKEVAAEGTTVRSFEGSASSSESRPENVEELCAAATTPSKRPLRSVAAPKQQHNKVQPIPLPLRKRGKRKMATWMWVLVTVVLVLLLFLAGNYISLSSFSFQNYSF